MARLRLSVNDLSFTFVLRATPTAQAILQAAPIRAAARSWGMEIYFEAGLAEPPALEPDARDLMQFGEIAYWRDGDAIAVGFGETPISAPGEIRLAAPCNIWADCDEDLSLLAAIAPGAPVALEREG